jgi:predicted lipid-binding transport protein (Tim44 family)
VAKSKAKCWHEPKLRFLGAIAGPLLGGALYGLHFSAPYIGGALLMVGALLFVVAFQRAGRGQFGTE